MVRATLDVPTELIVVDNNSSDETSTVAAAGGALVVFEPVNQIARARNTGARFANGTHLLFVDADTRPPLEAIEEVVSMLKVDAVGGGSILAFEGEVGAMARGMTWSWNRLARFAGIAAGCFVWTSKEAFETAGGFCEKRYAGEELVLSRALKRLGRERGQRFVILSKHPVETSARKLVWHGAFRTAALHGMLAVFPFLLKSPTVCRFWYRRPPSKRPS